MGEDKENLGCFVPRRRGSGLWRSRNCNLAYMDRGPAPQGRQNSAQGFNPGNPQNKRLALKGREMRVPDKARTYCPAKLRVRNRTIGRDFGLLRTFDLAPPSGRVALGGRFPGLKPVETWAESCRPCGAQNNGLTGNQAEADDPQGCQTARLWWPSQ